MLLVLCSYMLSINMDPQLLHCKYMLVLFRWHLACTSISTRFWLPYTAQGTKRLLLCSPITHHIASQQTC